MSGDIGSALSGVGSNVSNAFSALGSGLGNLFGGGAGGGAVGGSGLPGDTSGMSGFDVTGMFNNLASDAFNQDTGSQQASAAITPPAQAAQATATGQDPSSGIGGQQSDPSQPPQPQQGGQQQQQQPQQTPADIQAIRESVRRRQQNPAAFQTGAGVGRGPAGQAAGLYSPNISPPAAVRAGLLDPSMIDPATGQIRRDQPAETEDPLGSSVEETPPERRPAPPAPDAPPAAPGAVPRAAAPATPPPRVVPGTPGAPPGTPDLGTLARGAGIFMPEILQRAMGPLGVYFGSTTPAETGELPEKYWPKAPGEAYRPEDDPQVTKPPTYPPVTTTEGRPDTRVAQDPRDPPPKDGRKAAPAPRRVWVPETPGHYVPTTGNARGPATYVPGTPGHYEDAANVPSRGARSMDAERPFIIPGTNQPIDFPPEGPAPAQGRPPGPSEPQGSDLQGKPPEGPPGAPVAAQRPMRPPMGGGMGIPGGMTGEGVPPMLRDILGIAMPVMLQALAGDAGGMGGFPSPFASPMMFGRRGRGFMFPHMFRGGPLRAGYYPHPGGGIQFHPGGYHPGWGGARPRPAPNRQPGRQGDRAPPNEAAVRDERGFEQVGRNMFGTESGGRYDAQGPVTRNGDRAYGKYQVMGRNIGPWTQQAFGRAMSPQEFTNNPRAQEEVFRDQMTRNFRRYGNWRDAASVWFSGRPYAQAVAEGANDGYMTVQQYVGRALAGLGQGGGPTYAGPDQGGGDLQGKPNEGGAPTASQYTGSDQPEDINATVG